MSGINTQPVTGTSIPATQVPSTSPQVNAPRTTIDISVEIARTSDSPVEAGKALRSLDSITGSRASTNLLVSNADGATPTNTNNLACRDIYVGGAKDKDSTRIVQDFAGEQKRLHPSHDIRYFSYAEWKSIINAASEPLRKGEPLNIIGHSLGGKNAINIALARTELKITHLISIDPVGAAGDGKKPANVGTWSNVIAVPEKRDWSDTIASLGRFAFGTADTTGADTSLTSSANHGHFSTMMEQVKGVQMLNRSYQAMQ